MKEKYNIFITKYHKSYRGTLHIGNNYRDVKSALILFIKTMFAVFYGFFWRLAHFRMISKLNLTVRRPANNGVSLKRFNMAKSAAINEQLTEKPINTWGIQR